MPTAAIISILKTMSDNSYLGGKLLLALPGIGDERFARAVIFMCQHSAEGAMGLIINKPHEDLTLAELLDQIDGQDKEEASALAVSPNAQIPILSGGPVEPGRGFVLHSADYEVTNTVKLSRELSLTHTVEVLNDIAEGRGPEYAIIALGYAGWAPGQLDRELTQHGWLAATPDRAILFEVPVEKKWDHAYRALGINISAMSTETGRA